MIPDRMMSALLELAEQRASSIPALLEAALLLGATTDDPGDDCGTGSTPLILPQDRAGSSLSDRTLRCALAAVVSMAKGELRLADRAGIDRQERTIARLTHRNALLSQAIEGLAFEVLTRQPIGVRQAAMMFGFVSESCFDADLVLRRFRRLALVYHPDTGPLGSRDHMVQLLEARRVLLDHVGAICRR